MAIDNLFQRIKNSVRAQKSSFCSRATSVTLLGGGQFIPFNLVVNYIDCDNKTKTVSYQEVLGNNNYIPDCVQGGCPISITNGDETSSTLSSDINEGGTPIGPQPTQSYKSFVQYGTTNCDEPPPSGNNIILQPCGFISEGFIVDPTGYDLTQGSVYQITLNPINPGPITRLQCYTVSGQTGLPASYNITGMVSQVGGCEECLIA